MEWKEFGIEEVARLCGIQMKNDGIGAREIKRYARFAVISIIICISTHRKISGIALDAVQEEMTSVYMQE